MAIDVRGGAWSAHPTSSLSDAGPDRAFQLRVVNGFQLVREGVPVRLPAPVCRFLAFLATSDGAGSRSYVAGTLWPLVSEERARGSLRTVLWQLGGACRQLLELDRRSIRLSPTVWVDLESASRVAARLIQDPRGASLDDCRCPELYGDLLPDWYDDWLILARERYLALRLQALEAACERLTELGRWGEAIQAGLAAVAAEPLRESARRVLVRAYRAEGNLAAAVRQFESFQAVLREELGVSPSEQMCALARGLLADAGADGREIAS